MTVEIPANRVRFFTLHGEAMTLSMAADEARERGDAAEAAALYCRAAVAERGALAEVPPAGYPRTLSIVTESLAALLLKSGQVTEVERFVHRALLRPGQHEHARERLRDIARAARAERPSCASAGARLGGCAPSPRPVLRLVGHEALSRAYRTGAELTLRGARVEPGAAFAPDYPGTVLTPEERETVECDDCVCWEAEFAPMCRGDYDETVTRFVSSPQQGNSVFLWRRRP